MNPQRKISIITPTHNRRSSLERLLVSVSGQDHPLEDIEVVVVCDGCTDDTVSFLKNYTPSFELKYIEQPGLGAANARNQGAAVATGEQLIFLDDDIEASPGLVSAYVRACDQEETVVVGYLPMELKKDPGFYHILLTRWWEEKYHNMGIPGYRHNFEDLLSGNFSLRASMFRKLGGFNAAFRCREDYELGYRLVKAGAKIRFCREAWGYHRDEVTDQSRSHKRKRLEGYWDVEFARIHPEIIPCLRLAEMKDPGTGKKLKMFMAFKLPFLTDVVAETGVLFMSMLENLRIRKTWIRMDKKLHAYWYMRGVADNVKDPARLAGIFEHGGVLAPIEHEIDVSAGIARAGHELEAMKTSGVHVRYKNVHIATIRIRPGDMMLGAHDLKALLATRYAWQYYEAMILNGFDNDKNVAE
ncbi:MAG TPA: glycosyltransferase [Chitinophagaceae bacterium]|nr:glycosyltransferase [Chitinophagaceae bacterium]